MNELLQKHGCANVFKFPEGLRELMSDITREVLREQPPKMYEFIANYLSVLLLTREHGILAVKLLDDLCDCRPTVSEHLLQIGLDADKASDISTVIKTEVEGFEPAEGKEKVRESQIIKKILQAYPLDEDTSAKLCQVARNAFREYWYRKKIMMKRMSTDPEAPWEVAARHTLEIYKSTKPSFSELSRATERIQAAYRGYHVRKNILKHLDKPKKPQPKHELPGPPLDVAGSREIDLGPVIDIQVRDVDVKALFDAEAVEKLGLKYDPMRTITHIDDVVHRRPTDRENMPKAVQSRLLSERTQYGAESTVSVSEDARQTQVTDGQEASHAESLQRISFAEAPASVIPSQVQEDEVPEVIDTDDFDTEMAESFRTGVDDGMEDLSGTADTDHEVPEDIAGDSAEEGGPDSEVPAEVPEDIAQDAPATED